MFNSRKEKELRIQVLKKQHERYCKSRFSCTLNFLIQSMLTLIYGPTYDLWDLQMFLSQG